MCCNRHQTAAKDQELELSVGAMRKYCKILKVLKIGQSVIIVKLEWDTLIMNKMLVLRETDTRDKKERFILFRLFYVRTTCLFFQSLCTCYL